MKKRVVKVESLFEVKDLQVNSLFLGDRKVLFTSLIADLKNQMGENMNLLEVEKMQIQVDDVRRAIAFLNKTSETKKVVILSSFYWSAEAQNAMLKVLEDTPNNSIIFLIGLSKTNFLPTILSRVQKKVFTNTNKYGELATKVLELAPNKRASDKQVTKILKSKVEDYDFSKNEWREKKNREDHIMLLQALMEELILLNKEGKMKLNKSFLDKLNVISTQIYAQGGSPHLYIEWLLLASPSIVIKS